MKRTYWPYSIAAGLIIAIGVLVQWHFDYRFNESVRHAMDIPAMLFVSPGLMLNYVLDLKLPFDDPSHTSIIWLSVILNTLVIIAMVFCIRFGLNRFSEKWIISHRKKVV